MNLLLCSTLTFFILLYRIIYHYWLYGATVLQVNVIGRVFQLEDYLLYWSKNVAVIRIKQRSKNSSHGWDLKFLLCHCIYHLHWVNLVSLAIFGVFGMPAPVHLVRGKAGQVMLGEAAPCPALPRPRQLVLCQLFFCKKWETQDV